MVLTYSYFHRVFINIPDTHPWTIDDLPEYLQGYRHYQTVIIIIIIV